LPRLWISVPISPLPNTSSWSAKKTTVSFIQNGILLIGYK
jgi:hypothetical protein